MSGAPYVLPSAIEVERATAAIFGIDATSPGFGVYCDAEDGEPLDVLALSIAADLLIEKRRDGDLYVMLAVLKGLGGHFRTDPAFFQELRGFLPDPRAAAAIFCLVAHGLALRGPARAAR